MLQSLGWNLTSNTYTHKMDLTCVILDRLSNLFVPQLSQLENQNTTSIV